MKMENINVINTFCYISDNFCAHTEAIMRDILPEISINPNWRRRLHNCSDIPVPDYDPNAFAKQLDNFANYLGTNTLETILFIAIYTQQLNGDDRIDLRDIMHFIHCKELMIIRLQKPLRHLAHKGLIICDLNWHNRDSYKIPIVLTQAMQQNTPLSALPKLEMDAFKFCQDVEEMISCRSDDEPGNYQLFRSVKKMENTHATLPMVEQLKKLVDDEEARTLFYLLCDGYVNNNEYVNNLDHCLSAIYKKSSEKFSVARAFIDNDHPLLTSELLEVTSADFITNASIDLTDKGLHIFLGEDYELFVQSKRRDEDLICTDKIQEKKLFYNEKLSSQISFLKSSLKDNQFEELQKRLDEKSLPKGVAALFYGGPGTGKTESVLQLAKATGRNVYHVDISACRTMWYGESEKRIKHIFKHYHQLCKEEKRQPILLFNEADALFSKRREAGNSEVVQVENTIQNIILEEMEKLDGILIATTNLIDNLDSAFARRFLFKIKFEKPSEEAKKSIWMNKLEWLTDEDATSLAHNFDLSGGEIDNVTRKCSFEEVLNDQRPSLETLSEWCREEKLEEGNDCKLGF